MARNTLRRLKRLRDARSCKICSRCARSDGRISHSVKRLFATVLSYRAPNSATFYFSAPRADASHDSAALHAFDIATSIMTPSPATWLARVSPKIVLGAPPSLRRRRLRRRQLKRNACAATRVSAARLRRDFVMMTIL